MRPLKRLTREQIAEMRALRPTTFLVPLAKRYGITPSLVSYHCRGIKGPAQEVRLQEDKRNHYLAPREPYIHNA